MGHKPLGGLGHLLERQARLAFDGIEFDHHRLEFLADLDDVLTCSVRSHWS